MNHCSANLDLNCFEKGYQKDPVLLKDYKNGFVCENQDENVAVRIKMFEKGSCNNKTFDTALRGNLEENIYTQLFFSKENIQIIQNAIRAEIHKLTGKIIPPQNVDNLVVIMRSIFTQYGNYYETGVTEEIKRLNKLVLNYAIPQVYSSLNSYLFYLKDQASLPVPISQPIQTDRDFKHLEFKQF